VSLQTHSASFSIEMSGRTSRVLFSFMGTETVMFPKIPKSNMKVVHTTYVLYFTSSERNRIWKESNFGCPKCYCST